MKPPFQDIVHTPPNAKNAVLLLHGILSAPQYFQFLFRAIPKDFAVYGILFEGHGGTPEQLAAASLSRWREQVQEAISFLLPRYDKIILIAHSMGTLFALEEALRIPKKISGMLLLNVPLYARLTPDAAWDSLCIACGFPLKSERALAMRRAYSLSKDWRLWKYLSWVPRYLELFAEIRRIRKKISQLSVPCIAFLAKRDELVSPRTEKILKNIPAIELHILRHASHFAYSETERKQIRRAVLSLCKGNRHTFLFL